MTFYDEELLRKRKLFESLFFEYGKNDLNRRSSAFPSVHKKKPLEKHCLVVSDKGNDN